MTINGFHNISRIGYRRYPGDALKKTVIIICALALVINSLFAFWIGYMPDGDDDDDVTDKNPDDVKPKEDEFSLGEGKIIEVNGTTHTITVLTIVGNNVRIRIESEPREVYLSLGIPENVDTDGDDFYDVELNITDIDEKKDIVTLEIRPVYIEIGGIEDIPFWVEVPERKFGDSYRYDFTLFAQMYWENYTTGNYSKYTITGQGQWDEETNGPTTAESGYSDEHDVAQFRRNLAGSFTLSLDSSDTGKISVGGTFEADNKDYLEFEEKKTIKSVNHGELSVDKLPKATVPVPINYVADLRYYPDPEEERLPTLDEEIYEGKNISEGDTGSFLFAGSSEYSGGYYNWTAEDVEKIGDHPSLRVNITTKIFHFLDFKKIVWLSKDVPFPTKEFIRTNSTFEDEDGIFWLILETERTLTNTDRGSNSIPWKVDGSAEFPAVHPNGEYLKWDKIPKGGSKFDDLEEEDAVNEDIPVHMSPEHALDFALANSDELADFMKDNPAAYVTNAVYNTTLKYPEIDDNVGSHYWNLTLQDWIEFNWEDHEEEDEKGERKWPEHRYSLRVAKNITTNINPLNPYDAGTEIDKDYGKRSGWANFKRKDIDDEGLTLSGAIDILAADPDAGNEFFDGFGELDIKDMYIAIGEGGTSEEMPGAEIIQLITGITMPHSKYVWHFQKDTVYQSGDTFMTGMDVETGRLVYVMSVSGNQIMGLFS